MGYFSLQPFGRFMTVPTETLWIVLRAKTSRGSRHQTAVSSDVVAKQKLPIGTFELSSGNSSFGNPFQLVLMVPAQWGSLTQ